MNERALHLLQGAIDRLGSMQAAADMIGYSRTAVSLLIAGKYDSPTERIERAILARLDVVACPHLNAEITRAVCDRHHRGGVPQSDRAQLRHWVACRKCPVRAASLADERKAS